MERGESLGVRWHKNTTGSVDGRGTIRAFLSSPQSCPLLLSLWFNPSVCLSCLSLCSRLTQSCACPALSTLYRNALYAKKASTSHGNAFRIDPAKRGHKDALCRVWNRQSQYFLSFEDCCGGAFTKRRASKRELNVRKTQSLV